MRPAARAMDAGSPALPAAPFRLEHVDPSSLSPELPADVLGAVRFGVAGTPAGEQGAIDVPLAAIGAPGWAEVWRSPTPVTRFREDELSGAENGEALFVQLSLPEDKLAPLEQVSHQAYAALLRLMERRGYRHCLRTWNFLSDINRGLGDHERYRRFSAGRFSAVSRRSDFERSLPAASTLGTPAGSGLQIYLIASRHGGSQVENPRQVSAFKYPRQYGPRSPSFSRAMRVPWADRHDLLVSGTASIVGHESLHAGDPAAQLEQTLANLEALRQQAGPGCAPVAGKLYLRHPEDYAALAPRLHAAFGATPLHLLQGDICRRDLRLEIEMLYSAPVARG